MIQAVSADQFKTKIKITWKENSKKGLDFWV